MAANLVSRTSAWGGSLPVIAGGGVGRVVTVRGPVACESHKTLSVLGRWFGFGQDEIFSGLIGSAGCKIPGLVWDYRLDRYGSSLIQSLRTRMGPLNRNSAADIWQARRRPWGALHYGEVHAESATDAYLALTRK